MADVAQIGVDGFVVGARQALSPHRDDRPNGEISAIVVHAISLPAGEYSGNYVEQLFKGDLDVTAHADFADLAGVRVSSHLFIRRSGELVQFVPFGERAWHAGASSLYGRETWNDFAIGIELEGTDNALFTNVQYEVLLSVCSACMQTYGVAPGWVVGHSDIAPGRNQDPGAGFEWSRLAALGVRR